MFVVQKKVVPLHSQSSNKRLLINKNIGIWCNGNTTDSGPVILGSSPSIPTERHPYTKGVFFVICET